MLSTLAFVIAFVLTDQERVEVPVKNVSARYVIDLMTAQGQFAPPDQRKELTGRTGLVPEGATLELSSGSNSITVIGSSENLRETRNIIEVIDVAPIAVTVNIVASVPALGREFKASTTIYNNNRWDFEDRSSDSKLTVIPRVNGDGTVVMMVTCGSLGHYMLTVARIKPGDTLFGRLSAGETTDETTGKLVPALLFDYIVRSNSSPFSAAAAPASIRQNVKILEEAAPKELEFLFELTVALPDGVNSN